MKPNAFTRLVCILRLQQYIAQGWSVRFKCLDYNYIAFLRNVLPLDTSYNFCFRAVSRFVPSPWETALLCNNVSYWLGASLESTLGSALCLFIQPQPRSNGVRNGSNSAYGALQMLRTSTVLIMSIWIKLVLSDVSLSNAFSGTIFMCSYYCH